MAERFVKSHIAERVAEFIGARETRAYLESHGWVQGMPIIMAKPHEPLDDVMGLVAIQQGPALVATVDPSTEELRFLYVSTPSAALKDVPPCRPETDVCKLFEAAARSESITFRSRYTPHSAVAHLVPVFDAAAAGAIPASEGESSLKP